MLTLIHVDECIKRRSAVFLNISKRVHRSIVFYFILFMLLLPSAQNLRILQHIQFKAVWFFILEMGEQVFWLYRHVYLAQWLLLFINKLGSRRQGEKSTKFLPCVLNSEREKHALYRLWVYTMNCTMLHRECNNTYLENVTFFSFTQMDEIYQIPLNRNVCKMIKITNLSIINRPSLDPNSWSKQKQQLKG